jgi:sec-independent protein translocase protein TatB
MFDLAWSHILLLGVVALLVIGPKDLPRALRTLGVWVGRARTIAREFQSSLDQMIREAELEDVRKEVEQAATVDLDHDIERSIDPEGEFTPSSAKPLIVDEGGSPTSPALPASEPSESAPPPAAVAPPAESNPVELPADHAAEGSPVPPKSGTHD